MSAEKTPAPVRPEADVEKRVTGASNELFKFIGLKGQTKRTYPMRLPCSDYPADAPAFRLEHTWLFWGAPEEQLKESMDRLRKQLPANNWKIVKDGRDGSQANAPQIIADSGDGQVSADLRLFTRPPDGEYGSEIQVVVASRCYGAEPTNSPPPPTP
ncbi:hypothetical protein [Streptomyces sp. NPDC048442]|uniref:hypothetical protein n=1 Tax=Streptomyces sp. NPDC048442 TaxID=3154823 RepID=UPI00342DF733